MSASHLTQVTYVNGGQPRLAQLDPHSRRVTFQPQAEAAAGPGRVGLRRGAVLGLALLVVTALLLVIGAALVWALRKQRVQ
jgi:hypothetical protein